MLRDMLADPLDELPPDSRREIAAGVRETLGVDDTTAEDLIRSSEPLWEAMERAGGLVDSWGGGEFSWLFPRVLAFIRSTTSGG